jgi:hypothetical protein
MDAKDIVTIDKIMRHPQLSHRDFHEVERFGNDAFDYIRDLLSKTPGARTTINGLKLLVRLAGQAAQDSAGPRLPEVFDVASTFVQDPDLEVRTTAARMVVGTLGLLKGLGRGPDSVGGLARVLSVMRSSLSAEPKEIERKLLEEMIAKFEAHS